MTFPFPDRNCCAADFASGNPLALGTPATPYADATSGGTSKNNKATSPTQISLSTLLNGAAGTDSLTTNFVVGDTITVNGTPITFVIRRPTWLPTRSISLPTPSESADKYRCDHWCSADDQRRCDHAAYRHWRQSHGHNHQYYCIRGARPDRAGERAAHRRRHCRHRTGARQRSPRPSSTNPSAAER